MDEPRPLLFDDLDEDAVQEMDEPLPLPLPLPAVVGMNEPRSTAEPVIGQSGPRPPLAHNFFC
jgi:hypothetical protein